MTTRALKTFALLEATDKLVAFDPNTRLWCTTPRQVHALFNDTLLKEARQLLKDEEERKTEAREAAALAAELAATSKKPKGGIFIDDMAAVGGGGEAEADDEKTPPSWVDWGMQATGLDLVLKVLRASLHMHGRFVAYPLGRGGPDQLPVQLDVLWVGRHCHRGVHGRRGRLGDLGDLGDLARLGGAHGNFCRTFMTAQNPEFLATSTCGVSVGATSSVVHPHRTACG